ncbi:hypothetical protein Ddye_004582 [Dipteronia dyeriana]|uniref:Cation-transporting P-type ATPase N-terminal domain-containing protein n=1 Tax=Dipteronia dyeriana TaxID=168575 RepID=A0AAD9XWP7_9ROSI|nr:hypothetical protein Ddye_004582 [Dipteronia dyeriana]
MTDENRRHQDLEAGVNRSNDNYDDPFYIPSTKNAPISVLRRWRAAYRFQEAGQQLKGPTEFPSVPNGEFPIGHEQLSGTICGVKGLSDLLKKNSDKGISGDDADLLKRRNAFGSNTYPPKKRKEFLDVPLGSLARPYFDYIDASCSGFLGAWYKDRGKPG